MVDPGRLRSVTATGGALVTLLGSFLPWLRSGERSRSSYDLLEIVDRLGFSPDGAIGWAVRLWPLLPALLVLVALAHWWPTGNRILTRITLGVTAAAAAYAISIASAILFAPRVALFSVGPGPWVTVVGAVLLGAASWTERLSRGSGGPGAS